MLLMLSHAELGQQVLRVVRALSAAGLRCRSALATGGQADRDARAKSFRTQAQQLAEGVDILVAAPGRLLSHLKNGNLKLDQTQVVVLDEVDVLCGKCCGQLLEGKRKGATEGGAHCCKGLTWGSLPYWAAVTAVTVQT